LGYKRPPVGIVGELSPLGALFYPDTYTTPSEEIGGTTQKKKKKKKKGTHRRKGGRGKRSTGHGGRKWPTKIPKITQQKRISPTHQFLLGKRIKS